MQKATVQNDGNAKQVEMPRVIWIVGLVSFFSNMSSVVITAFSPEFIINILGGTPAAMGYIRGISEALSYLMKMFSGVISDFIGKRKILMLLGYLCAAFAKPMFACCHGLKLYISAQVLERITNGLRDTPRDALIADCAPKELKGASFGIRQSCAFLGSMIGAVVAFLILWEYGATEYILRSVYWIMAIPLLIAVALIYFGIQEPEKTDALNKRKGFPIKKSDVKQLGPRFWYYMLMCFVFLCSRYSESFLVYRARNLGMGLEYAPLVLAIMYLFNSPTAKLVGNWSDHYERKIFLSFGFCMMLASCIVLAFATQVWHVLIGVAIYGIHYGATQGTFYAIVSDYSPPQIKGTSIGIFNLVYCFGISVSNVITGEFWNHFGAEITFTVMSIFAFISAVGIMFIKPNKQGAKCVKK